MEYKTAPGDWSSDAREAVPYMHVTRAISIRRSCGLMNIGSSSYYYTAQPAADEALAQAIRAVARQHRRWGAPRILDRLRREGWRDNHKRLERLYGKAGLQVRQRKRLCRGIREPLLYATRLNQVWAMDFMSDALADGRRLRSLNIITVYSRESLWIEVDTSLSDRRVARILEERKSTRGLPQQI